MKTIITTMSGSKYTITETDGLLSLSADNVPNFAMPPIEGEHDVQAISPWPPVLDERLCIDAMSLQLGRFWTSRVESIEVTE